MILLDVGPLLALIWDAHGAHARASRWLAEAIAPFGICRVTGMGLVRLLSNESVMGDMVVTRKEAWSLLDAILADERFEWWDEPIGLEAEFRRLSSSDDVSHRLWTDDYLAAFASASGAALATLDRKLRARYPDVNVIAI